MSSGFLTGVWHQISRRFESKSGDQQTDQNCPKKAIAVPRPTITNVAWALYIAAQFCIIGESLIDVAFLPDGAYEVATWLRNIPHVG